MLRARSDVSDLLRKLNTFQTKGPDSVYRKAGSQLIEKILKEFDVLVRETPQYTGTTAASWEIGFQRDISGEVTEQPAIGKRESPLKKGTEAACSISIDRARQTLTETDLSKYATQDIWIGNEAPGYDTAEEGPVRAVNTPPGALKRFEARIAALDFEVDFYKVGK